MTGTIQINNLGAAKAQEILGNHPKLEAKAKALDELSSQVANSINHHESSLPENAQVMLAKAPKNSTPGILLTKMRETLPSIESLITGLKSTTQTKYKAGDLRVKNPIEQLSLPVDTLRSASHCLKRLAKYSEASAKQIHQKLSELINDGKAGIYDIADFAAEMVETKINDLGQFVDFLPDEKAA